MDSVEQKNGPFLEDKTVNHERPPKYSPIFSQERNETADTTKTRRFRRFHAYSENKTSIKVRNVVLYKTPLRISRTGWTHTPPPSSQKNIQTLLNKSSFLRCRNDPQRSLIAFPQLSDNISPSSLLTRAPAHYRRMPQIGLAGQTSVSSPATATARHRESRPVQDRVTSRRQPQPPADCTTNSPTRSTTWCDASR